MNAKVYEELNYSYLCLSQTVACLLSVKVWLALLLPFTTYPQWLYIANFNRTSESNLLPFMSVPMHIDLMLLTSKMPTVNEYIVCTDTVYICLSKPKSAYPVSMNVYGTKVLTQQLFALVCIA